MAKNQTEHQPKLPAHVLKSIERGLEQSKLGQLISLEEFKKRHLPKK